MVNTINKKALATQIFVEMNGHDKTQCTRKALIERFTNECDMTANYAALAVQNLRNGTWKIPQQEVATEEVTGSE